MGTLSFMSTTDIPTLRRTLGPVRAVSQRHSQRLIKWFDVIGWTHRQQAHVPFSDAPTFKIGAEWVGLGRLFLALWPMQSHLSEWKRKNPDVDISEAMKWILSAERLDDGQRSVLLKETTARLEMLTSGYSGCPVPETVEEYLVWWSTPPPKQVK